MNLRKGRMGLVLSLSRGDLLPLKSKSWRSCGLPSAEDHTLVHSRQWQESVGEREANSILPPTELLADQMPILLLNALFDSRQVLPNTHRLRAGSSVLPARRLALHPARRLNRRSVISGCRI